MFNALSLLIIVFIAIIVVGGIAAAIIIPIAVSSKKVAGLTVYSCLTAEDCKKHPGAKLIVRYYPSAPGTPEFMTDNGQCGFLQIKNEKGKISKIPLNFPRTGATYKCITLYPGTYTVSFFDSTDSVKDTRLVGDYFVSEDINLPVGGVVNFACRTNGREKNLIRLP